ncbi:MAG: hypothetical protein KGY50_01130 [Candidatus Thermoplasmatota archaeon]|nr:hypothetical protein [Candidatus Thermoplasmatota archaeon]
MRLTRFLIILLISFTLIISTPLSFIHAQPNIKTTDLSNLSFDQELSIPIDTSLPEAAYQPIDLIVNFDHNCWAKNETQHSIRIAYSNGGDYTEIESQIYDLSHKDETHIDACSIVFLIPEEATGDETYHVFYSDKETSAADYPDHITVKDTHYYYEPITGQIMDFDYYQINQGEYAIYGICQQGELLGNGMSNAVVKLLPESTEFSTKNAEQIAGFYSSYSTNPAGTHIGTQWAEDITKTVLVDGNLMTRIRVKGTSPNDALLTDNIYTYYYNPTSTKRLVVNTNHQTLKDIQIQGNQQREGTFASLSTIKARSGTIEDMNLGEILPKIHFYSEDDTIVDYDMPTDPDAHPADWLLGYSDDQDLGEKAWLCIDDPATGRAHGLIFEGNTGFLKGENDGIQVKASVHQHVKLPGLEADSGDLFAFRNAYENGEHITTLSKGENILFNVEYLALQTGGYERIDKESQLFQQLIKETPITRGNQTIEEEPTEEPELYTLKATVHRARSAPLGSLLSAALGRNISYLTAELHKATSMVSSGSVGRLKFNSLDIEFEDNATLIQKIQGIKSLFDFRNSTLFKTITFKNIEPGTYLIKIYKENSIRHDKRQFIGFTTVEVTEDASTRIFCKQQTSIELTVTDQNDDFIKNAITKIILDETLISKGSTDANGTVYLPIPTYTNKEYNLQTIYDGFLIDEKTVSLNLLNRFRPWTSTVSINRYNVQLNVLDTLGLPPGIDPRPLVKSDDMIQPTSITAEQTEPGMYQFSDLYETDYNLILSYKSWEYTEDLSVNHDKTLDIVFPAEFTLETNTLNTVGMPVSSGSILVERAGRELKGTINENGIGKIIAPPGTYTITINNDENTIASQQVTLKGDKSIDVVSKQPSMLHQFIPIILIIAAVVIAGFFFWQSHSKKGIYILLALLLLSSIFLPWWQLHGENNNTETMSETYLYPPTLITRTETNTVIGGEISEVPDVFITVLSLLSILLIVTSALIILLPFTPKKYSKISWILTILILILLILNIVLFWFTMSEVTKIGIGDFSGAKELSISIPGESEQATIPSTWGAGIGLYAVIASLIGMIILRFTPIVQRKILQKNKDE